MWKLFNTPVRREVTFSIQQLHTVAAATNAGTVNGDNWPFSKVYESNKLNESLGYSATQQAVIYAAFFFRFQLQTLNGSSRE